MTNIVEKVLNNNVVLTRDLYGHECIYIGSGIGYGQRCGTNLKYSGKFQKFVLENEEQSLRFNEVVKTTDNELIAIVEEEISYIQENIDQHLNENIHVTLIDHIAFTVERHNKNMDFRNPFNTELQIMYPKQYELASHLIKHIESHYQITLSDDEIGIIALHIHAAEKNQSLQSVRQNTELVQDMVNDILKTFSIEVNKSNLKYQRLLLHVCYAVSRINKNEPISNELLEPILKLHKDEFQKLRRAMDNIEKQFNIRIPDSEIGYMVIHVIDR